MKCDAKRYISATSVLVGTCIGAGFIGMPYVVSQLGFFASLFFILLIGIILLFVNLYMGEVALRTKGRHQLSGYAEKYLGKSGKKIMRFAMIFGIYSAIIAYLFGIGESLNFLIFGNINYFVYFSLFVGILMSLFVWKGINLLKKFESFGVTSVILILVVIVILFFNKIDYANLSYFNSQNLFVPFGVILFSFLSFSAISHVEITLEKNEKLMKRTLITGGIIPIVFYSLFVMIVVGIKGVETPEIATFALGPIFILLGILTMFNAYLSLGNALMNTFVLDDKTKKLKGWFFATVLPVIVFIIINLIGGFSFTKVISIGGVVSGGLTGMLILLMAKRAKKKGNRKPEYKIPINWFVIGLISLIFIFGILREVWGILV